MWYRDLLIDVTRAIINLPAFLSGLTSNALLGLKTLYHLFSYQTAHIAIPQIVKKMEVPAVSNHLAFIPTGRGYKTHRATITGVSGFCT
jgi:hypothetical protein